MVRIFNPKENKSIWIDDSLPTVSFNPQDWHEDIPCVIIELKGIHFFSHAKSCEDCKAFQNSWATQTTDWLIEYHGKTKRLDLSRIGNDFKDNQFSFVISAEEFGTKMKMNIDTDTVESLTESLASLLQNEEYEGCRKISDKIKAIS